RLFFFLTGVTGLVAFGVAVTMLYFIARYRRRQPGERTPRIVGALRLELVWTIAPLFVFLVMFVWGARVFEEALKPPPDALEVYVVGKQWMWKIQHPGGQREINELHIPVNRAVRLIGTSEDVIHSFFVPAFRIKIDVVPGRYLATWFQPNRVGTYHLFCAEYCGTGHASMIG